MVSCSVNAFALLIVLLFQFLSLVVLMVLFSSFVRFVLGA